MKHTSCSKPKVNAADQEKLAAKRQRVSETLAFIGWVIAAVVLALWLAAKRGPAANAQQGTWMAFAAIMVSLLVVVIVKSLTERLVKWARDYRTPAAVAARKEAKRKRAFGWAVWHLKRAGNSMRQAEREVAARKVLMMEAEIASGWARLANRAFTIPPPPPSVMPQPAPVVAGKAGGKGPRI